MVVTSYRWDFGNNVGAFGPTAATSYDVPGDDTVSLTVTSSDGLSTTITRPIRVEYVPAVHLAWENAYSVAGVPERFDGRPEPPERSPVLTYHWDFGDGATGSGPHATHTYHHHGAYWVSLTLTTPDGLSRTSSRRLTVKPAEAISRFSATRSGAHAVLLKVTVNGPGTLVIAGRRYTLAKGGSVSRVLSLTARQRKALRARHLLRLSVPVRLRLSVPVRFRPLAGRAITATVKVTITS